MAWTRTASQWRSATKKGKGWRSSEFNAIETAIGKYKPSDVPKIRLQRLKAILDAIAHWWAWKQEKKFGVKETVADKLSPGLKPRSFASSEESLVEKGIIKAPDDFSVRAEMVRGLVRDVAREIDDVLALDRSSWGTSVFTDPKQHKSDTFMYLVSAQTETPLSGEKEYRIQSIKNPELVRNAVISASVITQDSISLWGPAGFILKAPQRCISAGHGEDLAICNAVGMKHIVEKYIEMLRVYLTEKMDKSLVGLPAPKDVLPKKLSHHSEVMVLGRNYDMVTEVNGVFLLVDDVAKDTTTPASCYRQISQFITLNPPSVKYVVEELPSVTQARMSLYRRVSEDKNLPIVQIKVNDKTALGTTYFNDVHAGTIMFPFNPRQMVKHGSQGHLDLEKAAREGKVNKSGKYAEHKNCRICGELKVV